MFARARTLAGWMASVAASVATAQTAAVDFGRDVRPLLQASCVDCHGALKSKADLRLDLKERALAGSHGGTMRVIVPGDALGSPLYQRLISADEDERMPQKAPPLSAEQIELVRRWIDAGAAWPDEHAGDDPRREHWAYRAPVRAAVPSVRESAWVANPIDAFVLARLERDGLAHAPQASRATLLRRLSLDLIGLPPAPEEVEAFVADTRPDAYERCVDRLLASPHYGERMARPWLDLARYADTHGYEKDLRRSMWRYRDWVIEAFAANMPFDRFSIEQLAGDLLADASTSQRVATAFHRNTMLNEEGGVDAEEFRCDAVIDRVNTTASIWLGSTLACAQCHDHKYDPFSQRDYYRMFAAFDSTADNGRDLAPQISAPSAEQEQELAKQDARLAELERALDAPDAALDAEQATWERDTIATLPPETRWSVLPASSVSDEPESEVEFSLGGDGSIVAGGANPDRVTYRVRFTAARALRANLLRLEVLPVESDGATSVGRAPSGNFVLSEIAASVRHASSDTPASLLAFTTADADFEQADGPFRAANSLDGDPRSGWAVAPPTDQPHAAVFAFAEAFELGAGDELELELRQEFPTPRHALRRFRVALADDAAQHARLCEPRLAAWRTVGPFSAASQEAARHTAFPPELDYLAGRALATSYENGTLATRDLPASTTPSRIAVEGERSATYFETTLTCTRDQTVELFLGGDDFARVWIDGKIVRESNDYRTLTEKPVRTEVRLHVGANRVLAKVVNGGGPAGLLFALGHHSSDRPTPEVERALRTQSARRSADDSAALRRWYRSFVSERGRTLALQLASARESRDLYAGTFPTVLVAQELAMPRESHVFVRGSFLSPGERVEPGIPALFGELDASAAPPRLAFARWLVSEGNPLAARAEVNRLWEMLFGRGLVATVQDFGTRGDAPTHPELLDWLARELVDSGWDVKHVLRTIVLSSTYRQSSDVAAEAYARDPDNALLARGARFRVEAEMVRDIALSASGLLAPQIGGPSVFPPQPPGTWNSAYNGDDWKEDVGPNRYRRGLYTFAKRTAPYVTYSLFEAPSREVSCPRRARTNTPLQALALLDDPAFVEAAIALARRMLREGGEADATRIERGFRLCAARAPTERESEVLAALHRDALERFRAAPDSARERVAALAGAATPDADLPELAAWTSVASVLLNYDETVTRN